MKQTIDVFTGEVKSGGKSTELVSHAIGSCIVITAYDPKNRMGGMAHVMLPGKAPDKNIRQRTRYADDAIEELIHSIHIAPEDFQRIEICLVGAGNVLNKLDDIICNKNIQSIIKLLKMKNLTISAQSLGGTKRRAVRFDIETGNIFLKKGDSKEILLWTK
jgi:chemotaxis protein CheD